MIAEDCSAVLLVGGQSRRMGRDKACIPYGDGFLWQHQIGTLKTTGIRHIAISVAAGDHEAAPFPEEYPLLHDSHPGAGPINGVYEALHWSPTPLVMVLAVDVPQITAGFLISLYAASSPEVGAVPLLGSNYEPVAATYPKSRTRDVLARIEAGHCKLQDLVQTGVQQRWLVPKTVPPDSEDQFANWNAPSDIE